MVHKHSYMGNMQKSLFINSYCLLVFYEKVSSVSGSVHLMVGKQIKWRPQFMKINFGMCNRWSTPGLMA